MKIDLYSQQLYGHVVINSAGREEGMERQRIGRRQGQMDGRRKGVEVGRGGRVGRREGSREREG